MKDDIDVIGSLCLQYGLPRDVERRIRNQVEQAMTDIELEGVRLRAARRGTQLIAEALEDRRQAEHR